MEEREDLKQDLEALDLSVMFILLIIFAILLSLWATMLQREQVKLTLKGGDPARLPSVYPIRCAASSITIGCLGFFLCLALRTQADAAGGSPAARRSARVNTTASLLVLLASIIRLVDLQTVEKERRSALLEETTLPD